jgi:hypothetical protein
MIWQHASYMTEDKLEGRVVTVRVKHSKEVVEEIVRIQGMKIVRSITDPKIQTDTVLGMVKELRKLVRVRPAYVGVRQRPKASSSLFDIDDDSLARLVTAMDVSPHSYMLSWLSFEGLCEKLPSGTG